MPFAATWMDLEIIIFSEASQTKSNIICYLHVDSKKWYKWTMYKTEIDSQTQKTNLWLPKGIAGWEAGINEEFAISRYTLLYWASLVAQSVKNPPAMWETWVRSLGWEDPLEEGLAAHSSILENPMDRGAWRAAVPGVSESVRTEITALRHTPLYIK